MGTVPHKYLPDFIVQLDDLSAEASAKAGGHPDPLNLIVEIKGFRGEDATEKANTMRTCWIPGVNNLGKYGRWAFAEFTSVFEIDADFNKLVKSAIASD